MLRVEGTSKELEGHTDSFLRQHRFPPAGLSDCSDSSTDEIHETKKDFLIL